MASVALRPSFIPDQFVKVCAKSGFHFGLCAHYPRFSTFLTSASIGGSVLRTTIANPAAVNATWTIWNARGFYMKVRSINDALLHPFQHPDFGSLRAETLHDCAFVGGNDIGRNVIAQQIVTADFQDDEFVPGGTAESRRARTPLVVSPFTPWFVTATW
jgi:hypothetical protein